MVHKDAIRIKEIKYIDIRSNFVQHIFFQQVAPNGWVTGLTV